MALKEYTLVFAESASADQISLKKYIFENFRYVEYGGSFDSKMKSAVKVIKNAASSIRPTSFCYRGYVIYMLAYKTLPGSIFARINPMKLLFLE